MANLQTVALEKEALLGAAEDLRRKVSDAMAAMRKNGSSGPAEPFDPLGELGPEAAAGFEALKRLGCYAPTPFAHPKGWDAEAALAAEPLVPRARAFLRDSLHRKATAESAWQVLVGLGLWGPHENLDLIRLGTPTVFGEELEASAEALVRDPPADKDAGRRRDMRALRAFAIDDASTVEVDDAVSIEAAAQGTVLSTGSVDDEAVFYRVWVHIADPSRYVTAGSDLDLEARRRGSTLYLPTGTVPSEFS